MLNRTPVGLLVAVASVSIPTWVAGAEPPQTVDEVQQVPLETVLHLLNLDSPEQLLLGQIPDEVAQRIQLPGDLEVIATIASSEDGTSLHTVTAISRLSEAELGRALTASLLGSGWTKAPSPFEERTSGFAEARGAADWLMYCGADNAYAHAWMRTTRQGMTVVGLTVSDGRKDTRCNMSLAEVTSAAITWADDHVPLLEPPTGTESAAGWNDHGPEYAESVVSVKTDLSAAALLRHYLGQLVAAGWRAGSTTTTSRTAVADVSVDQPGGEPVVGFLLGHCGLKQASRCDVTLFLHRDL